jgi:hypothetical protein
MMADLFDSIKELQQDVVRNIVNILSSQEIFSDLLENKNEAALIADKAIQRVDADNDWKFHYTAAITYPFETNHFMHTRYSDGSYPIWYGSLDIATTIYETAYHMVQTEMQIKNIHNYKCIARDRLVYNVFCAGILIDVTKKTRLFPDLISDDYHFTQQLAKKIYQQGYPGLLTPSARYKKGINVNILKQELLTNPRVCCQLTYQLFPSTKVVEVYDEKNLIHTIKWNNFVPATN